MTRQKMSFLVPLKTFCFLGRIMTTLLLFQMSQYKSLISTLASILFLREGFEIRFQQHEAQDH